MTAKPDQEPRFQPVKSADRTLEVLESLAAAPARRTLAELARELGVPKSSLHGLLRTMTRRGWVEADPTGTRFGLGLRAFQVGAAYLDADDTVGLLGAVLDRLAAEFGETVHLGRLDGRNVVYLAKRESVHPLRLYSAIGRRLPAHTTGLGKALLAERAGDEVSRLLGARLERLTANTITDPQRLRRDLAEVRDRGYAIDREESSQGITCFAVPVPLRTPPVDAISLSVPTSRIGIDTESAMAAALRRAVTELSAVGQFASETSL